MISGVVVLALSGLAILAYRHPRGYQRFFKGIYFWYVMAYTGLIGRKVGLSESLIPAAKFFTSDQYEKFETALRGQQIGVFVVIGVGLALFAYLLFLYFLPFLLYGPEAGKEYFKDD
jgi:hypothetical protein